MREKRLFLDKRREEFEVYNNLNKSIIFVTIKILGYLRSLDIHIFLDVSSKTKFFHKFSADELKNVLVHSI